MVVNEDLYIGIFDNELLINVRAVVLELFKLVTSSLNILKLKSNVNGFSNILNLTKDFQKKHYFQKAQYFLLPRVHFLCEPK